MKTKEFIKELENHKTKELLFEYANNKYAGTNYHLTEVKNVTFTSVDCGGNKNKWQETHLQLWESPKEKGNKNYMTVKKVLEIIQRVDRINALLLNTDIKIEFGNEEFHKSIMNISDIVSLANNKVVVKLFSEKTLCKAPSECVEPAKKEVGVNETCCAEETGCC